MALKMSDKKSPLLTGDGSDVRSRQISPSAPPPHAMSPASNGQVPISNYQACLNLLQLAGPTIFSYTFTVLVGTASFVAVGRSGDANMQAGYGLGLSIGNVLVITIGFGLASGMDTLCSQALGSGRPDLCWRYFFRAMGILTAVYMPLYVLMYFSHPILVAMHQPHDVAMFAQDFLRSSSPGFLGTYIFEACRRFLIHSGSPKPPAIASMAQLPVHCTLLYILVIKYQLGPFGAGVSRSISMWMALLGTLSYIAYNRYALGWKQYKQAMNNRRGRNAGFLSMTNLRFQVKETVVYMRIAVPTALLLMFEWISFEAQIFQCAYLGAAELAAYSAMNAYSSLVFMFPMGVGVALSSYVGNCIGGGRLKDARTYTLVGVLSSTVFFTFAGVFLFFFRDYIAPIYSSNTLVRETLAANFRIVTLEQFLDGTQGMLTGVVKGLGLQSKATLGNAIGMLFLMQITGIYLGFNWGMAGRGLILGAAIGLLFVCVYMSVLLFVYADWDKCVEKAVKRSQALKGTPLVGLRSSPLQVGQVAMPSSPMSHIVVQNEQFDEYAADDLALISNELDFDQRVDHKYHTDLEGNESRLILTASTAESEPRSSTPYTAMQ